MAHQVRSADAAKPLAVSTPSNHDSPNAPATARSVYVIAHPAAQPARLAPQVWVLRLWPPDLDMHNRERHSCLLPCSLGVAAINGYLRDAAGAVGTRVLGHGPLQLVS